MASNRQLPAGDIDSLRSRLHDRALYPNQLDVDRRSYHEDAALSLRGSHRYTCPAWCGANFLPGTSPLPALNKELTDRFGTPYEPRLGGAETMYPEYIKMYPEYIKKMKSMPRPPKVAAAGSGGEEGQQP